MISRNNIFRQPGHSRRIARIRKGLRATLIRRYAGRWRGCGQAAPGQDAQGSATQDSKILKFAQDSKMAGEHTPDEGTAILVCLKFFGFFRTCEVYGWQKVYETLYGKVGDRVSHEITKDQR